MAQRVIRRGCEHFPRTVTSIEELPAPVFNALKHHRAAQDLDRLVVIPPQQYAITQHSWLRVLPFAWRMTPHRTLAFGDAQIVIVEGTRADALASTVIPTADLIAIHVDLVLLYSYVQLSWVANGEIARCNVEFNSVELRLLERGLRYVQQAINASSLPRRDAPPDPAPTRHFPLKFHNYAQISLLPGETIYFALHQPALRQPGQYFRPYLAPNRVILLTEQRLLVLEDGLPNEGGLRGGAYRINRFYYPRDRVLSARAGTQSGFDWLSVTVGTSGAGQELSFPLAHNHVTALLQALEGWFLR